MLLLLRDLALFASAALLGGAAFAPRAWQPRFEAWCIGIAWAIAVLGAGVFLPFALGAATSWYFSGYVVIAAALILRRHELATFLQDIDLRHACVSWLLLVLGCLLLLACVPSFSGGIWAGDWQDQYERTRLILRLRPEDAEFRRFFPLTSRPPLANVADAAFLRATDAGFARHQTFMLLLNSLAFFPAALFARTFAARSPAIPLAALFLALNPLFLQNVTYPWTKLIAAFFTLLAVHVLVAAPCTSRRLVHAAALMALATVTHYSACVWLLGFGLPWLVFERSRWRQRSELFALARAALAFSAIVGAWLVFALLRYGANETFGANSTVTDGARFTWREHIVFAGQKLWSTLVPHPLRDFDRSILDQLNPWTRARDELFYVYQSNLFFGVGSAALILLAWGAARRIRLVNAVGKLWLVAVPLTIVLGTTAHGTPDDWGLVHICLQPLVLLGLATAAALLAQTAGTYPPPLILGGIIVGWIADFVLGVVLHFTATAYELGRETNVGLLEYIATLSRAAQANFLQKVHRQLDYFADAFIVAPPQMLAGLLVIAILLALQARRAAQTPSPGKKLPPPRTISHAAPPV